MENYCAYISEELTRKLYDAGMPLPLQAYNGEVSGIHIPNYAQVFDWLLEKEFVITISADYYLNGEIGGWIPHYNHWGMKRCNTWHEAANSAIERALELIRNNI